VIDVHIYLKFALKVTHPFTNRPFRYISLNGALAVRAIAKRVNILSLIGSRQCAFQRAMDEPCTLLLSLPKGGSKRDCFKILPFADMQRIARVCPRQLSYLLYLTVLALLHVTSVRVICS